MMKKLFAWILVCAIVATMVSALPIFTFADDPAPQTVTPVYYPNGTVYLNEVMIAAMSAEQLANAFKAGYGDGAPVWNAEAGKLELKGTSNTFVDIHAVDQALVMENYTISADLCIKETTFSGKVLMGMGINSGSADGWNHGFYWQCNFASDQTGDVELYVNNYNQEAKMVNGGGSPTKKIYASNGYKIGQDVIHVEIKVGTELVQVFYDDVAHFTIEKSKIPYEIGLPFFMIRGNTTLAVDNLLIYSGTGDADPEKTISNTQPISEPEGAPTEEEESTTVPESVTQPAPESTAAPVTTISPVTTTAPETTNAPGSGEETTAEPTPKSGCKSSLGFGLLSLVLIGCFGSVVFGKKKEQ